MQPVNLCDELTFRARRNRHAADLQQSGTAGRFEKSRPPRGGRVSCSCEHFRRRPHPSGEKNLRWRPALGGGSGNAATTLLALERTVRPAAVRRKNCTNSPRRSARTFRFFSRTSRRWPPAAAKKSSRWNFSRRCAARHFCCSSRLRHLHAVGVSKPRAVSRGVERPDRPRAKN